MRYLQISVLLLFAMAEVHISAVSEGTVKGSCNDDIRLPCYATGRTKEYRYLMWYKTAPGNSTAILKYKNMNISHYQNTNSVFLGDDKALELRKVQPSDSGQYKCYLAATIGGQNDNSIIQLNVSECVHMSTVYPSTINSTDSCPDVEEITFPWAVVGLSLFSIGKIILSFVIVWVCDCVIFRATRRKQEVRGSVTGTTSKWSSQKS